MRVPIIRYGWLSPDGLMFRTYPTKEQADSAIDGEEYHDKVIYLNHWREIIHLTNVGDQFRVREHSSSTTIPQHHTIRDSAG